MASMMQLFAAPTGRNRSTEEQLLLLASRIWARGTLEGASDPLGGVRAGLGLVIPGGGLRSLALLLTLLCSIWPEPFRFSPCGSRERLSLDEQLLVLLTRAAGANDRAAFDRLLEEMLSQDIRERLFDQARVVAGAFELVA